MGLNRPKTKKIPKEGKTKSKMSPSNYLILKADANPHCIVKYLYSAEGVPHRDEVRGLNKASDLAPPAGPLGCASASSVRPRAVLGCAPGEAVFTPLIHPGCRPAPRKGRANDSTAGMKASAMTTKPEQRDHRINAGPTPLTWDPRAAMGQIQGAPPFRVAPGSKLGGPPRQGMGRHERHQRAPL